MGIVYDGATREVTLPDGTVEEFYCGTILDDIAIELIQFRSGEMTLQQMHHLLHRRIYEGDCE